VRHFLQSAYWQGFGMIRALRRSVQRRTYLTCLKDELFLSEGAEMIGEQNGSLSGQAMQLNNFGIVTANFGSADIDFFEKFSANVSVAHAQVAAGSIEKQIAKWNDRSLVVMIDASHPASSAKLLLGLRAGGFSGGIIIVFGTDKDADQTVHDYLEAGADEFLRKPMSEGILFVRIRALVQRKQTSSLLESAYAQLAENVGLLRHELATPLSVLQMSIASLKKPDFDSEKLESIVARCERQVAKMIAIVASFQLAKNDTSGLQRESAA
jgi:DNA-binding NarL/FixJ family response regulator